MKNLYDKNGILFWSEEEIKLRKFFEEYFHHRILSSLKKQNSAFQSIQIEAPLLTPSEFINKNYTNEDVYKLDNNLTLRPETTAGSFIYAKNILSGYSDIKYKPPIMIWQHGKSFRKEQDVPSRFMKLKEFYQLEFQIIFSLNTSNDYSKNLYPEILVMFKSLVGDCKVEQSDRLPSYSEETIDIVCCKHNMEVCSMSKRNDLEGFKVIEVAIGTDRCIYCFENKDI